MGLFESKTEKNTKPKKQNYSANQLSEDDLLNISGGQDFHSAEEEEANRARTLDILNKS